MRTDKPSHLRIDPGRCTSAVSSLMRNACFLGRIRRCKRRPRKRSDTTLAYPKRPHYCRLSPPSWRHTESASEHILLRNWCLHRPLHNRQALTKCRDRSRYERGWWLRIRWTPDGIHQNTRPRCRCLGKGRVGPNGRRLHIRHAQLGSHIVRSPGRIARNKRLRKRAQFRRPGPVPHLSLQGFPALGRPPCPLPPGILLGGLAAGPY